MAALADRAQKRCLELGASEVEVFAEENQLTEVYIERNEVLTERRKVNRGLGIRCLSEKKLGFAYTTLLNAGEVDATAKLAFEIAKNATPNPDWVSLPAASRFASVTGTYDEKINALPASEAVNMARQGLEAARAYDKRVNVDSGKLAAITSSTYMSNSHGIEGTESSTTIYFYLLTLAAEKDSPGSFAIEYDVSTQLTIDPPAIGRRAAEKAANSLGGKAPGNFVGTVIFTPDAGGEIIAGTLDSGLNGEEVYRKRSPLAGKINGTVANSMLTVTDDGTMPGGVGTSSFDDEGNPRQTTPLLERGTVKNFLYDSYSAHREGRKSTGNASRGGGGPRYASLPRTSHSNLLFQEGNQSLEEMVSEVDEGVIVGRFSGNITETSGDFSGTVKQGFYIKKGQIQHPLVRTMIAGNVYQLLHRLARVGRPRQVTFDGTYIPPLRVEEVAISTEK